MLAGGRNAVGRLSIYRVRFTRIVTSVLIIREELELETSFHT